MRWYVLPLVAALASGCGGDGASPPRADAERVIEIHLRLSRFDPAVVDVPVGTRVRFELINDDPIDHEFIVGDEAVHERHEKGTEPSHGAVPGEVSVPAVSAARTTYRFTAAGDLAYVCHVPGHRAYGMEGVVRVR